MNITMKAYGMQKEREVGGCKGKMFVRLFHKRLVDDGHRLIRDHPPGRKTFYTFSWRVRLGGAEREVVTHRKTNKQFTGDICIPNRGGEL